MKAHLTVRDTPLREGEAVQTLCELTIFRAKILLLWDQIGMNSPLALSTLLCFRKCFEAYISASAREIRIRRLRGENCGQGTRGGVERLGLMRLSNSKRKLSEEMVS